MELLRDERSEQTEQTEQSEQGREGHNKNQSRQAGQEEKGTEVGKSTMRARVELCSHIGGHKFAGNVIVYIPRGFGAGDHPSHHGASTGRTEAEYREARGGAEYEARGGAAEGAKSGSALGGLGIWYGRVEPRHVEGLVRETVVGGRVVGELCRGVVWGGGGGG